MRRAAIAGLLWLCAAASGAAQTPAPSAAAADRPGPWVIDIRGTTVSLPNDAAFFPDVPASTAVPSRGYGLDAGAHIYLLQIGPARVGVGGVLLRARGTASPGSSGDDEQRSSGGLKTTPDVAALLTIAGPQVSMNFGSRGGWSYLSVGAGLAKISTRTSSFADENDEDDVRAGQLIDHGTRSTINFGGGARWFAKPRLAFSFDLRFHIIGAGGDDRPTPRTTVVAASAGISLR